jgi:hypothetical protein
MTGTTSGVTITKNKSDIDIVVYQGKTINFEVIWGGSTPVDVTGFSAKLQARETAASVTTLFSVTNGAGITVGTTDGKFTISMTATNTAALTPSVGVYDFEITAPSGAVYLVMSGKFTILAEVSR